MWGNLESEVTWNKLFLWLLTVKWTLLETLSVVVSERNLASFLKRSAWPSCFIRVVF